MQAHKVLILSVAAVVLLAAAPAHSRDNDPTVIAALDEAAGKYVQVTITQSGNSLQVKRVVLELLGQKPIVAADLKRGGVAGTSTSRPTVGVDASGSGTNFKTGIGIGLPAERSTYQTQFVARIDLPDPKLYERLAGSGVVRVMLVENGKERDVTVPAPLKRY
ncbi:MAG: hypothetical protein ABI439_13195 [Rhodospirillales bacterium]